MAFNIKDIPFLKLMTAIAVVILLFWAYTSLPLKLMAVEIGQWMEAQGATGIIAYSVIYIVFSVLLLPCAFLSFAAGLAYGAWGVPIVLFATCIGATLAFFISRHFVKEQVDTYMDKKRSTRALRKALEMEGWKFMILLRISPFIPFNLNNYFLGTIQVRFFTYLWVTAVGALPGTLFFVYLGSLGKSIEDVRETQWILLIIGFIATVAMTRMTLKKTKTILQQNLV